jgi:hypothetical protein
MNKILLALQYWDGDRENAIELMEILSKNLPKNNKWADFVVYSRWDSTFPSDEIIEELKKVFDNVYLFKSSTQATGWPHGCNALWRDLAMDAYRKSTESAFGDPIWSKYKCVFSIESDCCPINDNWLEMLSTDWDKHNGVIMGAWCANNHDHPNQIELGHINGNCLFSMDIVKKVPNCSGTQLNTGWDTYYALDFKKAGWHKTKLIENWYGRTNVSMEEYNRLKNQGCVFVHGVKDNSLKNLYCKNNEN